MYLFRIAWSNQLRHHAHAQVLRNVSMRMRISNGSLFYHGCMCFWTHKLISFLRLMISYLCRKCATWSNIITWNPKLPSRSGNSKCNLAKHAWVAAYWPYSEQGHTLAIFYRQPIPQSNSNNNKHIIAVWLEPRNGYLTVIESDCNSIWLQ